MAGKINDRAHCRYENGNYNLVVTLDRGGNETATFGVSLDRPKIEKLVQELLTHMATEFQETTGHLNTLHTVKREGRAEPKKK